MTVSELFRFVYKNLVAGGIAQPHLESSWLIDAIVQIDETARITQPEKLIDSVAVDQIKEKVSRRIKGEPLAYLIGEKEFYSYRFKVDSRVLIPRPETEFIVDWAVHWLKANPKISEPRILDIGTGSGCIGLTLLKTNPKAQLTAVDISSDALDVARQNAQNLGVSDRVEFAKLDGSKVSHLLHKYDLVTANPPYIDKINDVVDSHVEKYEPHLALYSQAAGLGHIRGWLKAVPNILNDKAAVVFEIGSGQGAAVLSLFRDLGVFSEQYIKSDYSGHDRIVCGVK